MFTYDKLIRLLTIRNINKTQLHNLIGGSKSTIFKIYKNEPISLEVLGKLCEALQCKIEDIIEYVPKSEQVTDCTKSENTTTNSNDIAQILKDSLNEFTDKATEQLKDIVTNLIAEEKQNKRKSINTKGTHQ